MLKRVSACAARADVSVSASVRCQRDPPDGPVALPQRTSLQLGPVRTWPRAGGGSSGSHDGGETRACGESNAGAVRQTVITPNGRASRAHTSQTRLDRSRGVEASAGTLVQPLGVITDRTGEPGDQEPEPEPKEDLCGHLCRWCGEQRAVQRQDSWWRRTQQVSADRLDEQLEGGRGQSESGPTW